MIRNKILVLSGFLFLNNVTALAQITSEFDGYREKYPTSYSIRTQQETILRIGLHDGVFQINKEILEEHLFLYETGQNDSKASLRFSTFYEIDEIEASSYIPEDGGYREIEVTDFLVKDELEESFYDDVKSVNFIYPSLGKGVRTRLKYEQRIKDPRFLGAAYFGNFYPIENNKLTIIADKDIDMRFREINMEGVPVDYSEKSTRKHTIYSWELKEMDEFTYEDRAPNYKSILPHIIPMIVSYRQEGKTKYLLNEVSDLYEWYYTLVKDLNQEEPAPELVELVQRLTADKPNDLEKARAIYYWVQDNVKYIAFEYALGGFVPREANEVFRRKFGDCKDNSSLMLEMMEIAGIPSNLTWIGTRSLPYRYDEVPTPMADNHMILHFEHEGTSYFLDATGRYMPLEIPTSFIQGKEALISRGDNTFEIKEVPIVPSSRNLFRDSTILQIEGKHLKGRSDIHLSGYTKISLFRELDAIDTEEEKLELYNTTLRSGNNSFQIIRFSETNHFDYDKNFQVSMEFSIANAARRLGDEIYVNLNLRRDVRQIKVEKDRTMPLEHDYKDEMHYKSILEIPEGYDVDYLPGRFVTDNPLFQSSISYILEQGKIHYGYQFNLKRLVLEPEDFDAVREEVRKLEKQFKEVVVLKKL